jgi:hypothetical protein
LNTPLPDRRDEAPARGTDGGHDPGFPTVLRVFRVSSNHEHNGYQAFDRDDEQQTQPRLHEEALEVRVGEAEEQRRQQQVAERGAQPAKGESLAIGHGEGPLVGASATQDSEPLPLSSGVAPP